MHKNCLASTHHKKTIFFTATKNAQITINVTFSSHYKSASDNSQNSKFDRPEGKKHKTKASYIIHTLSGDDLRRFAYKEKDNNK